ncbi:YwqH-like family protein [Virgibacillus sp. FSP13]
MGSSALSSLYAQRSTVLAGIANSRNQIAILEEKIRRLQEASGKLSTSISELETTKSSIDGLTIDESRWKGEKEDKFEDYYDAYKSSVKSFISKTEDAKQTMEEDIARYESKKAAYETGLANLQNTLASIDSQISAAQKE